MLLRVALPVLLDQFVTLNVLFLQRTLIYLFVFSFPLFRFYNFRVHHKTELKPLPVSFSTAPSLEATMESRQLLLRDTIIRFLQHEMMIRIYLLRYTHSRTSRCMLSSRMVEGLSDTLWLRPSDSDCVTYLPIWSALRTVTFKTEHNFICSLVTQKNH